MHPWESAVICWHWSNLERTCACAGHMCGSAHMGLIHMAPIQTALIQVCLTQAHLIQTHLIQMHLIQMGLIQTGLCTHRPNTDMPNTGMPNTHSPNTVSPNTCSPHTDTHSPNTWAGHRCGSVHGDLCDRYASMWAGRVGAQPKSTLGIFTAEHHCNLTDKLKAYTSLPSTPLSAHMHWIVLVQGCACSE